MHDPADLDTLRELCRRWYEWADNQAPPYSPFDDPIDWANVLRHEKHEPQEDDFLNTALSIFGGKVIQEVRS